MGIPKTWILINGDSYFIEDIDTIKVIQVKELSKEILSLLNEEAKSKYLNEIGKYRVVINMKEQRQETMSLHDEKLVSISQKSIHGKNLYDTYEGAEKERDKILTYLNETIVPLPKVFL